MGPYEVLKTAQVDLGRTLAAELEETGVIGFTIGPGIVHTPGADAGIAKLAPLYGKTVEEFYALYQEHLISAEAAGAGFAAAIALAERFRGLEIGARQALVAASIDLAGGSEPGGLALDDGQLAVALALTREASATLAEQAAGWEKRPLFERKWMERDFRNQASMPADQWLELLDRMEACLQAGDLAGVEQLDAHVERLAGFYKHLQDMARGYEKDPLKAQENERIVNSWQQTAERLAALLKMAS